MTKEEITKLIDQLYKPLESYTPLEIKEHVDLLVKRLEQIAVYIPGATRNEHL